MTEIRLSNFKKRTPKFWRRIGDSLIYSLPFLTTAVIGLPISPDAKAWVQLGIAVLTVGGKFLTKLFAEEVEPKN